MEKVFKFFLYSFACVHVIISLVRNCEKKKKKKKCAITLFGVMGLILYYVKFIVFQFWVFLDAPTQHGKVTVSYYCADCW